MFDVILTYFVPPTGGEKYINYYLSTFYVIFSNLVDFLTVHMYPAALKVGSELKCPKNSRFLLQNNFKV